MSRSRSHGLPPALAGGLAGPVLRRLPRRVTVRGSSMVPTLREGDVVLALPGARVRPGSVCLVRWGSRPGQLSVKRLRAPATPAVEGLWQVYGDDPDGSTDSRALGPAEALASVPWRLWPRPGWLRPVPPVRRS